MREKIYQHIFGPRQTLKEKVEETRNRDFKCYSPEFYETGKGNIKECKFCDFFQKRDKSCKLKLKGVLLERPWPDSPYLSFID